MLVNSGQGTRSYGSSMPADVQGVKSSAEIKEHLKLHLKTHMEHRVHCAMLLSDLAYCYCKMGLDGHKHKMEEMSIHAFKEMFKMKRYYYAIFEESPKLAIQYEFKDQVKSIDDIHNKLYESAVKSKESLTEILKLVDSSHEYAEMKILFDLYAEYEKYECMMNSKMKRSQMFGYDVAYILNHDDKLEQEYRECMKHKKRWKMEQGEYSS